MNDKPVLSIILPSIRNYNWNKVIDSIENNCKCSWELIICGPFPNQQTNNIKIIEDFGSPTRASQIAATLAEGKIITWTADDGVYINDGLTKAVDLMMEKEKVVPCPVVTAKYTEGDGIIHPDSYYKLVNAYPNCPCIDRSWWILNVGFLFRDDFFELGGWDCKYECCPLAHADLAVRAQGAGLPVYMLNSNEAILECSHTPGTTGDHAPVHFGQTEHDEGEYRNHYNKGIIQPNIPLSNWRNSPAIWKRRFK